MLQVCKGHATLNFFINRSTNQHKTEEEVPSFQAGDQDQKTIDPQPPERQAVLKYRPCMVLQAINIILNMGHEIDSIDDYIISLDDGIWHAVVDENLSGNISLSFHVDTDPAISAMIFGELSDRAAALGMSVFVADTYAYQIDENGIITDMAWGEDAYRVVGREPLCTWP